MTPEHVALVKNIFEPSQWPEFALRNEFRLQDEPETPDELEEQDGNQSDGDMWHP